MNFGDLRVNDTVYYLTVKDSEIVENEVQSKEVASIVNNKWNGTMEISLSDGTMIIPYSSEMYAVKGLSKLSEVLSPLNFTIYCPSKDICLGSLKKIISIKMTQLYENNKKINDQITKLCLLSSIANSLDKKESVVLEPIYAD